MRLDPRSLAPSRPRRRGIATLEMVLAMPVLLALAAIIFTMGIAGTVKLHTTVDARQNAWKKRHGPSLQGPVIAADPAGDLIREEAHRPVKVARVLNPVGGRTATSTHAVLGGSWDFHDMPFDSPPDMPLALKMAAAGGFNNIGGLASSLTGALGSVSSAAGKAATQAQAAGAVIGQAQQKLDDARKKLDEERQQIQNSINQVQTQIQDLKGKAADLQSKLQSLNKERENAQKIQDPNQRKQALDGIDKNIKSTQGQLNQANSALQQAQKELGKLKAKDRANGMAP